MKKLSGPFAVVALATVAGACISTAALAQPSTAVRPPAAQPATDPLNPIIPVGKAGKGGGVVPRGEPEVNCTNTECQNFEYPRIAGTSFTSCGTGHANLNRVADQFRTTNTGGTLTSLCWWGTYSSVTACGGAPPADRFEVTIYNRVGAGVNTGVPDTATPVGVRSQTAGNLTVTRRAGCNPAAPLLPWFEYTATITGGIVLQPNTCYFIEVRNTTDGTINWFWSRCIYTADGLCFQDTTSNGYALTELIGSTVPPTNTADRAFCMNVAIDEFGTGNCLPPAQPPPANDTCDTATLLTAGGATATGDTTLATNDNGRPCGDARENQGRGVWFRVVGNGNTLTATSCLPGTTATFDTKLSVYCGDTCASLNCVAGNDDAVPACAANALASSVSWCSENGRTYYILIHGFNGTTGAYEVGVTSDATNCTAAACAPCVVATPSGALEENEEPCGTANTNGGCNTGAPPQANMTVINCGDTYHGTAWAANNTRDTDWYLLNLTATQEVTVTVEAEFPHASFFIQYADLNTCTGAAFPGGVADGNSCQADINRAVLTGPGSYVIFVGVGTPGGGGTFNGIPCDGVNNDYIVSVECREPCLGISIPGNAIPEVETCGLTSNDGCNLAPAAATFENVNAGDIIAGTSYAVGGTRDTDWYRATAPGSGAVSVDLNPAFDAVVFLLEITFLPDGTCDQLTAIGAGFVRSCTTGTVSGTTTGGGTYYVFVSPGNPDGSGIFDGLPCNQDYVLTIAGAGGPPCCDFNNDNVVNSQDFFEYLIAFFASAPAAEFDGIPGINSADFFAFIVCFFAPPPGCP